MITKSDSSDFDYCMASRNTYRIPYELDLETLCTRQSTHKQDKPKANGKRDSMNDTTTVCAQALTLQMRSNRKKTTISVIASNVDELRVRLSRWPDTIALQCDGLPTTGTTSSRRRHRGRSSNSGLQALRQRVLRSDLALLARTLRRSATDPDASSSLTVTAPRPRPRAGWLAGTPGTDGLRVGGAGAPPWAGADVVGDGTEDGAVVVGDATSGADADGAADSLGTTPTFFHFSICSSSSLSLLCTRISCGVLEPQLHRAFQSTALDGLLDVRLVFRSQLGILGGQSSCDRRVNGCLLVFRSGGQCRWRCKSQRLDRRDFNCLFELFAVLRDEAFFLSSQFLDVFLGKLLGFC